MLNPDVLATLKNNRRDDASLMPDISNKKVLIGFWHNFPDDPYKDDGYKYGNPTNIDLIDVPPEYNVVTVAFMGGSGIPTFVPDRWTDAEFRRQIGVLNAQGRPVLLSLGGAEAHVELAAGQEEALAYEIIRLVETYGFDGLDIDLEQTAILAGDNITVIPAALKMVKDHYREEGKNFIITMAPEFPYLRTGASYEKYAQALDGYYDIISPQLYNQAGDGLWVEEINTWLTQNNDALKEEFLYYMADSFIHGTRGFIQAPADKLVLGIPTNVDAAGSGYVIDENAVLNALQRLEEEGNPIKGLMTWSINWDIGKNKEGESYDWEFIRRYGQITGENGGGTLPQKPSAPANLISPLQTDNSIQLQWEASRGESEIAWYIVYRNNTEIAKTQDLTYTDSGLTAGTEYVYKVVAVDTAGLSSASSASLTVSTTGISGNIPEWQENTWYNDGDTVSYAGKVWRCVMQHTSNKYWTPDIAKSLWQAGE